jgi:hypothetical protein
MAFQDTMTQMAALANAPYSINLGFLSNEPTINVRPVITQRIPQNATGAVCEKIDRMKISYVDWRVNIHNIATDKFKHAINLSTYTVSRPLWGILLFVDIRDAEF